MDGFLEEDDLKWCQRAKQRWLQEGNRNTKYFHKCATQRKLMNSVTKIQIEDGSLVTSQEEVGERFQSYYLDLFSSSNPEGIADLLERFEPLVTADMNLTLTRDYSREEVENAIFEMNPLALMVFLLCYTKTIGQLWEKMWLLLLWSCSTLRLVPMQ